jgi:hypothetical protein
LWSSVNSGGQVKSKVVVKFVISSIDVHGAVVKTVLNN